MPACFPSTRGSLPCAVLSVRLPYLARRFLGVGAASLYPQPFARCLADPVYSVRFLECISEKCVICHQIFIP